ncbi:MAG: M48 family metalloprotease, partial [Nocardioides sp.]
MPRSRFVRDVGLTFRMTTVMFLLGALLIVLVVTMMYLFTDIWWLIGLGGIGFAFFQWWRSDTVAMRAMRAYEVSPEEYPELHGTIDRLCALAEMPKPRVGISELDIPNAFATGRSPDRAVVCVTTGIMGKLTTEELEG